MDFHNFVFTIGCYTLLLTAGSGAGAQMTYSLNINGKDAIAGIFVTVQNPDSAVDAHAMVSGQAGFNAGDIVLMVTAGEIMAVSESELRFLPSEKTEIGEVAIELGPETVFCLRDGTPSKDWLAAEQKAVVTVPQSEGHAISVRNALWIYEFVGTTSSPLDPSCTNADYPVLAAE